MPTVKINGLSLEDDNNITLRNGDLIVVGSVPYIVSSYVKDKDYVQGSEDNHTKYCSFVSLRTGQKAFSEPCTRRNTSLKRIMNHLHCAHSNATVMDLRIVPNDKYEIAITINS